MGNMSAPTGIPSPSKRRLFCWGTLWCRYPSEWDHHLAPLNTINEVSTHADRPHEIAENVILCGSKLKARHPLMSIIIVGILPIEEAFGGRKSSQIDKVNKILEESCQSHGFLFAEQARCWREPSSGDINQSLFWRDGLHLNKKGCGMLAKIYADNIQNLLQSPNHTTTNLQHKTHIQFHLHLCHPVRMFMFRHQKQLTRQMSLFTTTIVIIALTKINAAAAKDF